MLEPKIEQLRRIESTSLQYLKYFFIFWGTLVLFILYYFDTNTIAKQVGGSWVVLISGNAADFPVAINNIFFLVIVFLTGFVSMFLLANGIPAIEENKHKIGGVIEKKREFLVTSTQFGILNSTLLVAYLVYLANINTNIEFKNLIIGIQPWVIGLFIAYVYLAIPLLRLIDSLKEYAWRRILVFSSLVVYGVVLLGIYPLGYTQNLVKLLIGWNDIIGFGVFVVLVILLYFLPLYYLDIVRKIRNLWNLGSSSSDKNETD